MNRATHAVLPPAPAPWMASKRVTKRAAMALLLSAALPALAVRPGQTMPSMLLDTAQGPRQIATAQARVTYVDFWASWCGPCRQSFPWMNAMHGKYGGSGLRIVAVNLDAKRAEADEFLARNPAQFAIAYDRDRALAQAVDVKAMPTSLLLDQRGRVLLVHHGFAVKDRDKLEAAIAEALRESQPAERP